MSTMEAVQKLADYFAQCEEDAVKAKKGAQAMRKCFEEIRNDGHIGGLECQALSAELESLMANHEAALFRMHADLTKRAKESNIDLPQRDGGR